MAKPVDDWTNKHPFHASVTIKYWNQDKASGTTSQIVYDVFDTVSLYNLLDCLANTCESKSVIDEATRKEIPKILEGMVHRSRQIIEASHSASVKKDPHGEKETSPNSPVALDRIVPAGYFLTRTQDGGYYLTKI
jgi:hypothetical protein